MQSKASRLVRYPIYTMGDLGSGIYSVLPSILLMFYMTNVLGIPVTLATAAAFVPKVVDLICSPIVGALSDRTRTRMGRRRPYLLAGSLAIFPTFTAIWLAPFSDPTHSAYFILAMFTVCTMAFSLFVIPFFALNAELPRDYHDRTAIHSWRTAYTFCGAILAGAGAPLIVQAAGGGRHGYLAMGTTMAVIMAAVTFVTFLSAREPPQHGADQTPSLREMVTAVTGNRPYIFLLLGYFIHITSAGLYGAVLAYFVIYVLARDAAFLSFLFFLTYSASIAAIPFWGWLSTKIGKLRSLQSCIALIIVSFILFAFISYNSPTPVVLATVLLFGVNEGGVQVFAFSMLADCIHHGNGNTGAVDSAAMFNGVFIAGEKLGFAAGALVSGIIFSVTGLVETTQGTVAQPETAIEGIRLAISWVPAVLNLLVIFIVNFYGSFEGRMRADHAAKTSGPIESPAKLKLVN